MQFDERYSAALVLLEENKIIFLRKDGSFSYFNFSFWDYSNGINLTFFETLLLLSNSSLSSSKSITEVDSFLECEKLETF